MTDIPTPDVVPEEEMNRRRRVLALSEDIGDLASDLFERVSELSDLVPEPMALLELIEKSVGDERLRGMFGKAEVAQQWFAHAVRAGKLPSGLMRDYAAAAHATEAAGEGVYVPMTPPLEAVIDRLFAEAPKLEHADGTPDETQAPALECHVMLRGIPRDLFGALSKTPEGTLRMLTPATRQDPKSVDPITRKPREVQIFCEQFFDISDVVSVMVERPVTAETSSLITSA